MYLSFCEKFFLVSTEHGTGLDAKFKIPKLSHQICATHECNIKSKLNKKLI